MKLARDFALAGLLASLAGCQALAPAPAPRTPSADAPVAAAVQETPPPGLAQLPAPVKPAPVAQAAPAPEYEPDRLIVSLAPDTSPEEFLARVSVPGMRSLNTIPLAGHAVVVIQLPGGLRAESARERVAATPGVRAVYLDTKAYPHLVPKLEFYPQQWAHGPKFANTEAAWDRLAKDGVDQTKVVIADIDTGVETEHPALAGRVLKGYQPTAYANNPSMWLSGETDDPKFTGDQFGHGTFTAGIAAADGAGNSAMAGVAWQAKLMPIKVDHEEQPDPSNPQSRRWGFFDLSDIVAGIQWVADHNAPADGNGAMVRVINMSLGGNTLGVEPLYVEVVAYARSKGILCIASTGNGGADQIPPPANTPGVVAVGATSHYLNTEFLSPDSNYGARLDLVAPGGGIVSTVPMNSDSDLGSRTPPYVFRGYAWASGTSEAAPFVSGVAALVFAKYDPGNASLKTGNAADAGKMVDRVRAQLLRSCDDLGAPGWDPAFGAGRINVDKALSAPVPLPDGPAPAF